MSRRNEIICLILWGIIIVPIGACIEFPIRLTLAKVLNKPRILNKYYFTELSFKIFPRFFNEEIKFK